MRIAVLISGSGRSLKNFLDLGNKLKADIKLVVANHLSVSGLKHIWGKHKIVTQIHTKSETLFESLDAREIDLVVMAGWLIKLKIPDHWTNRVMNIHPSLLPEFGGKGMYGHHVHEAVIKSGARHSGCTVHFADNEYDHGPIILQRMVEVSEHETPDSLADKVFEQELLAYPAAVNLYAMGCLRVNDGQVFVSQPKLLQTTDREAESTEE